MCGILAVISRDQPVTEDLLQRGMRSMRHRGPDGTGCWISADGEVGIGHTRLSIIDLSGGQQPIGNEQDNIQIAVNGEFYGYENLQSGLLARGHRLRTRSDSEVALHLYEEMGVGCVRELRGEFALVIWDSVRRRLLAIRDRFGIKPLYYIERGTQLWIASEIKALAAMGALLEWDEASLAQSFYANPGADRTLFKGVRQVPPGCYLQATPSQTTVSTYWKPDFPREVDAVARRTDDEWVECLRAEAKEAVRLRLRSDVPIGTLLSGGLDSSAALGIARTFSHAPIKAFTIAFEHPAYDESPAARLTADQYGADFHAIHVASSDFAQAFENAVWHTEGVHYNAHGAARFILSRIVRDAGIKVVLAGEGADEISAGYRFFDPAFGSAGVVPSTRWSAKVLKHLESNGDDPQSAIELQSTASALNFPYSMVANSAGQRARDLNIVDRAFASRTVSDSGARSFFRQFNVAGQIDGREPVRQLMHLWLGSGFPNYVLGGERLDMAHGVEQRLPFLDHLLFEEVRNVPVSLLRRDGREKWILREALKPFISAEVYHRKKQPFFAPPSTLQDGSEMLALALDLLRSEAMKSVPFFSYRAIGKLIDQIPKFTASERASFDPLLLMMMSLCVLHQRYVREHRSPSSL